MEREKYYLDKELIDKLHECHTYIYNNNFSQQDLLPIDKFTKFIRDKSFNLTADKIKQLWHLGFINADIIKSKVILDITGLEIIHQENDNYVYIDKRILNKNCTSNCLIDYVENKDIDLYFYENKIYVIYHIQRYLNQNIGVMQVLINDKGFQKLHEMMTNVHNEWITKNETINLFHYWNILTLLCNVFEPLTHQIINKRITWNICNDNIWDFNNRESVSSHLKKYKDKILPLINETGEEKILYFMNEISRDSESIDKNKDLHLIIRLMKYDERRKINDKIGASMVLFNMVEILRRGLELSTAKQYDEEDERGFGQVSKDSKFLIQGGDRILDDDRLMKNQFLRKFGLDYNIRVRVYVEGQTEFFALKHYFSNVSTIQFIDLKGQFIEGKGKGLSFKENLKNDKLSKIFSIVILDGDVDDNIRTLYKAIDNNELCGGYVINNPDFETENFEDDLYQVVFNLQERKDISLEDISSATKGFTSGSDFFKKLKSLSSKFNSFDKGGQWGVTLMEYAIENQKQDRKIYEVIKFITRCNDARYEPSKEKCIKL